MGFGRSDKPEQESEYTIQRHANQFGELMDELGLDGVTLVPQDSGGPIGLAWAVDHPERVRRLVLLNTFARWVPPEMGKVPVPFRLLCARGIGELLVKRLHVFVRVFLFRGGRPLDANAKCAYLAPHPTPASRAGVQAYPRLIPWDESDPTRALGRHVEDNLSKLHGRPTLMCWPMKDPGFSREEILQGMAARFPGAEIHRFGDASHYIQEDAHERVVPCWWTG
jgi:pimeloyl-ACP methyl ester carboxylesterase